MTETKNYITPSPFQESNDLTLDEFAKLKGNNFRDYLDKQISPVYADPAIVFQYLKKFLNVSPQTLTYLLKKVKNGEISIQMQSEDPKLISYDGQIIEWDFSSSLYNFSFYIGDVRPLSRGDEKRSPAEVSFAWIKNGQLEISLDKYQHDKSLLKKILSIFSNAPDDLFTRPLKYYKN